MNIGTYLRIKYAERIANSHPGVVAKYSREIDTEDVPNAFNQDVSREYSDMLKNIGARTTGYVSMTRPIGSMGAREWAHEAYKQMQRGSRNISNVVGLHTLAENTRQLMLPHISNDDNREYLANLPIRFRPVYGTRKDNATGFYDYGRGEIVIDSNRSNFQASQMLPTIGHELGHPADMSKDNSTDRATRWYNHSYTDQSPKTYEYNGAQLHPRQLQQISEMTASAIPYNAMDAATKNAPKKMRNAIKNNLRLGYTRRMISNGRACNVHVDPKYTMPSDSDYNTKGDTYINQLAVANKINAKQRLGAESADAEYSGGERKSVLDNLIQGDPDNAEWYRANRATLENALRLEKARARHDRRHKNS